MRYTVILMTTALILLAACTAPNGGEPLELTTPFIGGTSGLTANFIDFRTEVFDGGRDPFDVVLKIENHGETDVEPSRVKVKLSGVNPTAFGKFEEDLIRSPEDAVIGSRVDTQGGILPSTPSFVEFTELNHFGPISGAQFSYPLRAELCYLYSTRAVSKLCVRSNILSPEAGGICEVNENKPVFNSGAPVQISNVKESARAKDRISFSFEISNAGTGNIFERGMNCDSSVRKNENRVYVSVDTGMPGIQCTGLDTSGTKAEGFTTLFDGRKIVTCTQTAKSRSDFEQQLNIEVLYDYEEYQQTTLVVKSSGEVGVTE